MPSANSIQQKKEKSQQKLLDETKNVDDTANDAKSYSIPQDYASAKEAYNNGKISRDELVETANKKIERDVEKY